MQAHDATAPVASRVAVKVEAQAVQTPLKVLQAPHFGIAQVAQVLMPVLYLPGGQEMSVTQEPPTRA